VSTGLVGDFRERLGIHAGIDRLTHRRVDRDREDESVGAEQGRSKIPERRVARGVGAVGNQHQRRAVTRALIDHGQRGHHGVVNSGTA
jgi:hypothetical protein